MLVRSAEVMHGNHCPSRTLSFKAVVHGKYCPSRTLSFKLNIAKYMDQLAVVLLVAGSFAVVTSGISISQLEGSKVSDTAFHGSAQGVERFYGDNWGNVQRSPQPFYILVS
jgi:hypothetical protein